jgi:HlyD family secretion protein
MKKNGRLLSILIIVGLIVTVSFIYYNRPSESAGYPEEPTEITGSIEAEETDINVKVPGRVSRVLVEEGQEVNAGDVLAEMEANNLEAKKEQTMAAMGATQAQYSKALAGARPQQLAQVKDLMEQAKVALELSKSNYDRYTQLYHEGVLPEQKLDMARTDLEVAKARYHSAEEQYALVREGAQKEDVAAAKALVEQARAAYHEVETYMDDTRVKAPVSGVVSMTAVENGEMVSTGMPLATITDYKNTWVELKVRETSLHRFAIGRRIPVRVLGVPGRKYIGKVVFIAAKPSYATERATQEKGEKDVVSFGVKIKLGNDDSSLKPGMTAIVTL